ncbi:MAG TPA: hypothetical protein VFY40_18480 [Blastocatellia bacterium]|nr:hypothetical protein [Blastocatellia bacterium]
MNCREFENIVNDLARAESGMRLMGAASRAESSAHAEICGRCAARLADERALSAGLKSLAASDEGKGASPSVETALLKAFHARSSNQFAPRLPIRSKTWPRRVPRSVMAAAAIIIAFGFITYRAIRNDPRKDNNANIAKTPSQPVIKPEGPVTKDKVESEPPRESRAPQGHRRVRPRLNKPFIIDSMTTYAKDNEDATDFFPLAYGGDPRSMERGEVIRVQTQRSALIAFGLPVNVERADAPVIADLVVGEDGMPLAMRFVRLK